MTSDSSGIQVDGSVVVHNKLSEPPGASGSVGGFVTAD
eukprot:SAG31_NODE_47018_length_252_cov_0.660131_1_plen_37_part_10